MAARKVVTADDKSALIEVWAVFFAVVAFVSCIVRTSAKLYTLKTLKLDDLLTIAGTLFTVGQTVATYSACEQGLGRRFDTVDAKDLYFKSKYAADLLLVLSLASCKLAFANGLRLLTPQKVRLLVLGLELICGAWGLVALFVVAFQCQLPSPWVTVPSTECIDMTGFYTYFSVVNIITDLAVVVLLGWSVNRLQTGRSTKVLVVSIFCTGRILLVPAIVAQIVYSNQAFASDDLTFNLWKASVAIAVVQFLAVFSVCLPNFKFLLDILESGQVRLDDLRRKGYSNYSSSDRARSNWLSARVETSVTGRQATLDANRRHLSSRVALSQAASEVHEMATFSKVKVPRKDEPEGGHQATTTTTTTNPPSAWDRQSQTSQSSQTILIHQSWRVESKRAAGSATNSPPGSKI